MTDGIESPALHRVAQAYSSPHWWYDIRGFFILHLSYQDHLTRLLNFFAENGSQKHLEIAVGSGSFLELVILWRRFIKRRPRMEGVAVDYAPSMLEGAVSRFGRLPGWNVQLADAADLPFSDGQFETANMANALHSMPDPRGAIAELFRVLRPGGRAALNVVLVSRGGPFRRWVADRVADWGMRKGILVRPYTESEVRGMMLAQGFTIERTSIYGNDFCLLVRKPL